MERNDEDDEEEDPLPEGEDPLVVDDDPRPEDEEKDEGKRTASSSKPVVTMGRSATISAIVITTQRCGGMNVTPAPLSPVTPACLLECWAPQFQWLPAPPGRPHPLLRRRR